MFISQPHDGRIYIAERSRRHALRLRWSVMPVQPVAADTRLTAGAVPLGIRRQAYRMFYADRKRGAR